MLYGMYKQTTTFKVILMISKYKVFFTFVLMQIFVSSAIAVELNAVDLLAKADAYRNFKGQSFSFDLKLNSMEPDKKDKVFSLKVEILNSHTSLVIYDKPISERGKALLMAEKNLWFHSPSSRKPIRITPQQRLLGEASNGDVASTDLSGDYIPKLFGSETIDSVDYHILELTAKADSLATYDHLKLWLRKDNFKPFKADFFAASGKLLKTAYYKRYEKLANLDGKEQLTAILIMNPLVQGKQTLMEYSAFKVIDLSPARFTVNGLRHLQ